MKKYQHDAVDLLAVLKRDFPQVAEEYKAGKFPSVRQAALSVGLVKKRISVIADSAEHALRPLVREFGICRLQTALDSLAQAGETKEH